MSRLGELFLRFQHRQPESHAIHDALSHYFGENVTEEIVCYRLADRAVAWAPKAMVPSLVCCRFSAKGKRDDEDPMVITARGLVTKCNAWNIQHSNTAEEIIEKLEAHLPRF